MIEHLSSSQINLYLQCSLKYRFQYIDQIPRPFKSSGLAFGSVIHSTLAWLHKEKMNGNGVTLDRLYRIFNADWYSQKVDTDIRYKENENEMKLTVMAKEMLGIYFYEPVQKIKGAEVPFTIPFVNPVTEEDLGVNLEGIIDLIEEDETIVEFKTSAQMMNDIKNHLQLTAYSFAYEMLYQRPPKLLKIIDFVKTKKPKMVVLETTRDQKDYQRFFSLAKQVLSSIKGQIFFPRTSFMCKDCEFERPCKAWGQN